jgi:hypothetical protein
MREKRKNSDISKRAEERKRRNVMGGSLQPPADCLASFLRSGSCQWQRRRHRILCLSSAIESPKYGMKGREMRE